MRCATTVLTIKNFLLRVADISSYRGYFHREENNRRWNENANARANGMAGVLVLPLEKRDLLVIYVQDTSPARSGSQ